ncbi:uncharacterized protein LOC115630590 [Scaptodrosophila lebanonensis]|uniref:Uncharacterized protein LOC115630590 n=1 Tax=Drosophila lebanonensis TaxID=7225 RepID=A0A6J2U3U2_DROLE|nr:uncharacterized protein LOC115630590 [Scaptodrosophila lebanonensis]
MELRSKNYNMLAQQLKNAGVYEEGMEVEEMRQIAEAIELSTSHAKDDDLERAIMESELEFLTQPGYNAMLNSTMIAPSSVQMSSGNCNDAGSSFLNLQQQHREGDSPPSSPVHITVAAWVHHSIDWTPNPERRTARKRVADGGTEEHEAKRTLQNNANSLAVPEQRAADGDATPISMRESSSDSGISWEQMSSLSLAHESSTIPSIGEMPSRLLISTSSAAVSDFSRSDHGSHDGEQQELRSANDFDGVY